MVTVDPKTTNPSTNQSSAGTAQVTQSAPQETEFDLDIVGTATAQNVVETTPEDTKDQEISAPFDFNLDLPDSYETEKSESETQEQSLQDETPTTQDGEVSVDLGNNPNISPSAELSIDQTDSNVSENINQNLGFTLDAPEETAPSVFSEPVAEEAQENNSFTQLEETAPSVFSEPVTEGSQENSSLIQPEETAPSVFTEPVAEESQENSSLIQPEETAPSVFTEPLTEPSLNNDTILDTIQEKQETQPSDSKVLNLDEMISQFSTSDPSKKIEDFAQSQLDPFDAMKLTLAAQNNDKKEDTTKINNETSIDTKSEQDIVAPVESQEPQKVTEQISSIEQNQTLETPSNPMASQTLDLDSLVGNADAPIANIVNNPISAPVIPSVKVGLNKKLLGIALSVVSVVLVAVIAFIRYPDLFSFSMTGKVIEQPGSGETLEHGAAYPDPNLNPNKSLDSLSGTEVENPSHDEMPTNTVELSGTIIDVDAESGDQDMDIQTIDLASSSEVNEMDSQNQNSTTGEEISTTEKDQLKDPLDAVEGIVGPINNDDLLKQEILEYQRKGVEFKENGVAQNKRRMLKYGLAVEKETQKLLDELANGGNIDISSWGDKKSQLDDYLLKASNA